MKVVKFAAFRGKTHEFAVASEIRELCKSRDGREKLTAVPIEH